MGSEGRRLVEQKFSSAQLGRNLLNVYQDIADYAGDRKTMAVLHNTSFENAMKPREGRKLSPNQTKTV
jgi:hypothetical protein